jgi:hypothetical protein
LHAELNGEKRRLANHRHQMQAKFVAEVSPHQHWTKWKQIISKIIYILKDKEVYIDWN